MTNNYYQSLPDDVKAYEKEARKIRRALHQIPETGFKEKQTGEWIKNYLKTLGYDFGEVATTGVYVYVPSNIDKKEPCRALRTDMDALEITEPETEENRDYRSRNEGCMHACGHDGHMTMMLLTARYLKEHPDFKHGPVLLLFQPAEEGPGGALPVSESGIFEKYQVKEIYGYHLFPFVEEGVVSSTPGPMMAMTSEFYITIRGKSSHAGNPEKGVDAIVAGAAFVSAIQSVLSRNIKRDEATLINIGTFNGGERMNIVPGEAKITGTMRSYSKDVQETMRKRMREVLDGVDLAYGTKSELEITDMYPPVRNDRKLYERMWALCPEPKEPFEKVMLAEDFAIYQDYLPGLFMGIGCLSEEKGYTENLHTPGFNFDEKVLLRGLDLYLRLIASEKE